MEEENRRVSSAHTTKATTANEMKTSEREIPQMFQKHAAIAEVVESAKPRHLSIAEQFRVKRAKVVNL